MTDASENRQKLKDNLSEVKEQIGKARNHIKTIEGKDFDWYGSGYSADSVGEVKVDAVQDELDDLTDQIDDLLKMFKSYNESDWKVEYYDIERADAYEELHEAIKDRRINALGRCEKRDRTHSHKDFRLTFFSFLLDLMWGWVGNYHNNGAIFKCKHCGDKIAATDYHAGKNLTELDDFAERMAE